MRRQNDGGAPPHSGASSEMPRIQPRFAFKSLITVPGFREIGRISTAIALSEQNKYQIVANKS